MGNCHSMAVQLLSQPCIHLLIFYHVLVQSLSNSLCHCSLSFPLLSQCCLRCYHNFLSLLHILTSVMFIMSLYTLLSHIITLCVHVFMSVIFIYHLCTVPMSILLMLALAVLSWILTSVMPSHSLPVNPLSCPQSSFSPKLMGSNHPFTASHPCTVSLLSPLFYHCFTSSCLLFVIFHTSKASLLNYLTTAYTTTQACWLVGPLHLFSWPTTLTSFYILTICASRFLLLLTCWRRSPFFPLILSPFFYPAPWSYAML